MFNNVKAVQFCWFLHCLKKEMFVSRWTANNEFSKQKHWCRVITKQIDRYMSSIQDFFFIYNNPEAEGKRSYSLLSLWIVVQHGIHVTSLGFCLRIIMNEKPINLEKTTSSVLSVLLLIYGHGNLLHTKSNKVLKGTVVTQKCYFIK